MINWNVYKFLNRKRLSFRRVSTHGRDLPKNVNEIIDTFLSSCSKFIPIDRDHICNMDETTIYLDSPARTTYNSIGEKRVPAVTSGKSAPVF